MPDGLRDRLRLFSEMADALSAGDTDTLVRGGRHFVGTMTDGALPTPLATLMALMLDHIGRAPAPPPPQETGAAPAGDTDDPADVRDILTQFLALAEVMSPGTVASRDVSGLQRHPRQRPGAGPGPGRPLRNVDRVDLGPRVGFVVRGIEDEPTGPAD
ncbi:hypothetical protein [Streptomyces sp. NPDC005890]|uniref:hypothetical protein n=1 Tax=Streptomyces sp. NPDC005890 TaxID=3154568 RepID=UPI0033FFD8B1